MLSTPDPDARDDKQPWVLPTLRLFLHARRAGVRRRAQFRRQRARDHRDRAGRRVSDDACRSVETRARHRRHDRAALTAEAEWKRSYRHRRRPGDDAAAGVPGRHDHANHHVGVDRRHQQHGDAIRRSASLTDIRVAYYRCMATAGLELRWPVLFSSTSSSHVLEPMAQVFARPDEHYVGDARHPQRGRAELRLRRLHAVRARQVLRLRPHRRRHARQSRLPLFRRLRQRLDHQRASSASPTSSPARTRSPRRTSSMPAPIPAWRPTRPTMSACSASPRRTACRLRVSARLDEQTLEMRRGELKAGYSRRPRFAYGEICLHPGAAALRLPRRPPAR